MVFSSLIFLYSFFSISLLAYLLCRTKRAKNVSLLVFSLIFYAWGEPRYVLLLMFMAFCSWFCALRVVSAGSDRAGRGWLILSCCIDIALIGFFKYSGMICSLFSPVPEFISNIALPIGISFYTFQLLTYVVDVYRGDAAAQKSYWNVLLYAALFHQCIAGPIVRYKSIDRELFGNVPRESELLPGIQRFCTGLAKKALLANPCGALADKFLLADSVAGDASLFSSSLEALSSQSVLGLWLGIIAYSLHIYLDFSAYSDMAIGMGKMIGLHYPENFDHPYVSRSVTEFWRRWHMSLSSFFRDYVYIPLGGSRKGRVRGILNAFIVWALTGLWHGASWNFVLWGLWFFVFLMLERLFLKKLLDKLPVISNLYLLLAVVLGWVLFRFTDLRLGLTVLRGLFGLNGNAVADFTAETLLKNNLFLLPVCILASTPLLKWLNGLFRRVSADHPAILRVYDAVCYAFIPCVLLILSTASLVGDSYNPFIYFQF